MAGELDVAGLIAKLQHNSVDSSGSTQHHDGMWKKILCQVVNGILADVDKVSELSAESQYEVTLDFITHMISACPQVFVYFPAATDETPPLSRLKATQGDKQEENECYGLTSWVLCHMLRLLAHPECSAIHPRSLVFIRTLLQMIKVKDTYMFKKLLVELIHCLADLVHVDSKLHQDPCTVAMAPTQLKCFTSYVDVAAGQSGDSAITARPIVLSDARCCEQLQIAITDVLCGLSGDVCQYAADLVMFVSNEHSKVLWASLAYQLEVGEVQLKTVSLRLCSDLLGQLGLPRAQVLDYFLSCVQALIELLCSGFDECEGDYVALEKQLCTCLSRLMSAGERLDVSETEHQQVCESLEAGLSQAILNHGLTGLRTETLRSCLCATLADLHGNTSVPNRLRERQRRADVVTAILDELGNIPNAQHAVPLLRQAILHDLARLAVAPGVVSGPVSMPTSPAATETTSDTGCKRRKLSTKSPGKKTIAAAAAAAGETSTRVSVSGSGSKSPTVIQLHHKLLQLHQLLVEEQNTGLLQQEHLVQVLEGIRVILEVCALVTHSESTQDTADEAATSSCFPHDQLPQLISAWKSVLSDLSPALGQRAYPVLVRSISAVIFAQGDAISRMEPELSSSLIALLSLAWLPVEMTWLDLKPWDAKDIMALASGLTDSIGADVQGECVRLLAMLPKDLSLKWRLQVLKLALSDSSEVLRCAAIKAFAYFLYHSGPNANHLVYDLLHGLLQDKSSAVQVALAQTVGSLACVVSRKAVVRKCPEKGKERLSSLCLQIKCITCDKLTGLESPEGQRERPKIVDPNMFLIFLDLLKMDNKEAKLYLVKSFPQMFGHIGARSNNVSTVKMVQSSLTLLQDPDHTVRKAFSQVLQHLLGDVSEEEARSETDHVIITQLRSAAKVARSAANSSLLETILLSIGQMARIATGEFLLLMIIILLESICCPPCPLAAAVATQQLKQIATCKQLKLRRLFQQYGRSICKVVVEHMHEAQRKRHGHDPLRIMHEVAHVFTFEDTRGFLRRAEHLLLPHLVKKATPTASALTKIVAKQMGDPNHKGPLARNIRYIFSHLVCSCQAQELRRTFAYLEGESEWDLGALLRVGQNVDSELLLSLSTHHNQVMTGLKILTLKLNPQTASSIEDITDEQMAEILQPKLLGILVHFDNQLNNSTLPLSDKKQAYESLISLMQLMGGKPVTKVRVRMMTTLKIGLKFKDKGFPELCCRAWNCFVHTVELASLGSMLSQIIVSLLTLVKSLPKQVADILYFLIIENRKSLNQHFHELYFLPDVPELADVNRLVKEYTEGAYKSKGLKTHLEHLLKGTTHESGDVRQLALSKLRHLLHNNQAEVHTLILCSETADPFISQIVTTLLQGCRGSDQNTRSLYAECLGELGAIDPGRLELSANSPKSELTKFQATVNDDNFAFDLFNELAKAFLRAEDRNTQDCVAYAIQELIQIYEIQSDGESNSSGHKIWSRLGEEVQEILTPLLLSRYMLTMRYDWSQLPRPIYGSKKGNHFDTWVSSLCGYLGSKLKQEKAKQVFDSCRGVIKNDSQVALYLLPHAVVHVLLDGGEEEQTQLIQEILVILKHVCESETRHGSASDLRHMSAQTVFSALDHLTKWTRHRVMVLSHLMAQSAKGKGPTALADKYTEDPGYRCIMSFLDKIPQDTLALASYNVSAHTRALMHYEQFLKQKQENVQVQQHLDFLQKLYIALDEPDGLTGITAIKQSTPTLGEQILAYESIGQLSDASVCYDQAIRQQPQELSFRQGLLRCRLALGGLNSAMDLANGLIAERPGWSGQLNEYRVEAAWKLGQWDKLSDYLQKEDQSRSWNVGLGKVLLAAKRKDEAKFIKQVGVLRNQLMGPLSAASMEVGSYQRGYEYIVRLHMLNEVEQARRTLLRLESGDVMDSQGSLQSVDYTTLVKHWEARLQFTQSSYRTQEPILNLRRILLGLCRPGSSEALVDRDIGQCWLQTAKIARGCGLIQTAHSSLLSAGSYDLPDFSLEYAQWLWERGDYDRAQTCLERAVEVHHPDYTRWRLDEHPTVPQSQRLACAKMLLQLGLYCEETASFESNTIMRQYKEVQRVHSQWEDASFYIAKYYDKILVVLIETDRPEKKGEFILQVVQNFGTSLLYGSQFIYQSMPRMLALWLDYGSTVVQASLTKVDATAIAGMRNVLTQLNKCMANFCNKLAPYQFLTAFPQLISRICHTHMEVFTQLKEICARLLMEFPQQAMWLMMAVSKSTFPMRVKRCQEIFTRAKSMNPELNKFLLDSTKLTDRLLDLCNKNVEGTMATMSISQHFKPLQRLLSDSKFSRILLPLQRLMTPTLPSSTLSPGSYNPFPGNQVYISGIEDTVEVLPSLQRPKKITLQGSDGKLYIMLCKPKDDLRKDTRLMEFNGIINKCLRKDPESRRRDLHIRTYTVTPLNEECGLLEWVSNTSGLRHILLQLYKERGIKYMTGRELKSLQLGPSADLLPKKLEIYKSKLLPRHPPLFSQWLLKTFPDPTSWYNARLAYCCTTAVMSMVGYILGLGDRHGENILFDSTNGDTVHVDFNCLFNKGETFDYAEIVPFRLTHNMTEAMGPMGYEGIFRRACEVTMRVMRDQMDPLMSVLKPFIYDPLVEWNKPTKSGRSNPTESGEIKNEKAQTHIINIEARLKGVLKSKTKPRGLPLSVEGHCNHLIKEASDEKNLCQMYIGWAPYM